MSDLARTIDVVSESGDALRADALSIPEVVRLVNYAGESAIEPAAVEEVHRLLLEYEQADRGKRAEIIPVLHRRYSELASATKPVNGRTLLETERGSWFFWQISSLILLLVATGVGSDILASWMDAQPEPEEGWRTWVFATQRHILEPAAPLVWGALGASVYLGKRVYDTAQMQYFDPQRLKGWWLRVILGAVLAVVVLSIFSPESLSGGDLPLAASAVAFLVGLGVKVVYGALESTVQALSSRTNLDSLRRSPKETSALRTQLATELREATENGDSERIRVLTDLLKKAGEE